MPTIVLAGGRSFGWNGIKTSPSFVTRQSVVDAAAEGEFVRRHVRPSASSNKDCFWGAVALNYSRMSIEEENRISPDRHHALTRATFYTSPKPVPELAILNHFANRGEKKVGDKIDVVAAFLVCRGPKEFSKEKPARHP